MRGNVLFVGIDLISVTFWFGSKKLVGNLDCLNIYLYFFQPALKIARAYRLAWDFRIIYEITSKNQVFNAVYEWMQQAKDASIEHFEIACDTKDDHLEGILSFSTNTNPESLNVQMIWRANLRGVNDPKTFL